MPVPPARGARIRARQRLLDRQKIPPGETLLQRLTQQIGRVERRHAPGSRACRCDSGTAPARPGDAVLGAEERMRRGCPMQTSKSGSASSICRWMNGRQIADSCGVGVRLPGGRHGTMLAMYADVRSSPIAAIMRSSSLPERPTNGKPSISSSRPGASPTNITRACGLPSANTSWVAVVRRAQPSKRSRIARNSSRLAALRAAWRAAMMAASGAGGGPATRHGREIAGGRDRARWRGAGLSVASRPYRGSRRGRDRPGPGLARGVGGEPIDRQSRR